MRRGKQNKGITLVALVITIIILLILAGITLNLMIGQEGIITKAQEAGKVQKIATIKEKIMLDILDAETEAKIRKEQLEEEQVKDIISKYGELQEDGDTIKLKEVDEEISLKDIYNGTINNTGSYTGNKEKIEQLEKRVEELEKVLEESSKTEEEKAQELTALKGELAKVTVTEDRILKGYTAYKGGGLITGTMEDRGILNWNPSSSESYTLPAGFYNGGTISTSNAYTSGYNAGVIDGKIEPLAISSIGTFILGTNPIINITDANVLTLTNLNKYKKCTLKFEGNMGTYISARIYLDNNLVTTISDQNEHTINLNNNNEMVINLYSYNSLSVGGAIIRNLKLE